MSEQRPPQPGRLRRVTLAYPKTTPKIFAALPEDCATGKQADPRIPHRSGVGLAPALNCSSIPNAKHVASSETPAHVELTAFTGASWPRTSHTPSRAGSREEARGDVCWPRSLSALSSRIGASNPAVRAVMIDRPVLRLFWRGVDALDYLLSMATD